VGRHLQLPSVGEVEHPGGHCEHHDHDRREVRDEREEGEVGRARDDDVGRVADERRCPADVRREDLDEDERDRVDVERVRQQERDRHHQEDHGEVVDEGGQAPGRRREAQHDRERPPARELARADRQVRVDPGRLRQADDDHHPREQAQRVPVDRLDRGFLADRLREEDGDGAEQRDLRPVHSLRGDQDDRCGEDHDGSGQAGLLVWGHASTRADQSSRLT
jgi:hypothetical protein